MSCTPMASKAKMLTIAVLLLFFKVYKEVIHFIIGLIKSN